MKIEIAKTKASFKKLYNSLSEETIDFLPDLIPLIDKGFNLKTALAYVFFIIEQGHRTTLYCGARKLHKTESSLTWKAIDSQHITLDSYPKYFKTIYGFSCNQEIVGCLSDAVNIRNKVMHGSSCSNKDILEALSKAIQYIEFVNEVVAKKYNYKPFNNAGYPLNASIPYILCFLSTICRWGNGGVTTACCIR